MSKVVAVNTGLRHQVAGVKRPNKRLVSEKSPEMKIVAGGVRGRAGLSAFEDWEARNPGGTWAEFMSELGTGITWNNKEW